MLLVTGMFGLIGSLGLIVLLRYRTKGMLLVMRHHWNVRGYLRTNRTVKT